MVLEEPRSLLKRGGWGVVVELKEAQFDYRMRYSIDEGFKGTS